MFGLPKFNQQSSCWVASMIDAVSRAPDVERVRMSFERWMISQRKLGRLLQEDAEPSSVEAPSGALGECKRRPAGIPLAASPAIPDGWPQLTCRIIKRPTAGIHT